MALGRAGPPGHLGPQARSPTRVPRPLRHHPHAARASASSVFPQIAQRPSLRADPLAATGSNDHGVAGTIGLTGSSAGGVGLDGKPRRGAPAGPGSVVARVRSAGAMPPFMVVGGKLHQGKKAIVGEGGGTLGGLYDPFRLEYDPARGTRIPALQMQPELRPSASATARPLHAVDQAAARTERTARIPSPGRLPPAGLFHAHLAQRRAAV